jgi:hypothetical protein
LYDYFIPVDIIMRKIAKFTISMSVAEFKDIESMRRKTGRTRSQFVRDALAAWRHGPVSSSSIKEDQAEYGAPPSPDSADLTDTAERRRRAIAAAGKFRSGVADLSVHHDRYLEDALTEKSPTKKKR